MRLSVENIRDNWLRETLGQLPAGETILDVVDPMLALEKFSKLLKPGGRLILTAPFNSLTHFAPYHFATGFNQFIYRHHLDRLGFNLSQIHASGNYISYVNTELKRLNYTISRYNIREPNRIFRKILTSLLTRYLNNVETVSDANHTSDLGCYGYFVVAIKRD